MNTYYIVFALNDTERLFIELEEPFELLSCYCQIPMIFITNKQEYVLSNDIVPNGVEHIRSLLHKTLKNQLQLDSSITKDIGYLNNIMINYNCMQADEDIWQPHPDLHYEDEEDCYSWVGYRICVSGYRDYSTWLYNSKNGDIIFEITPFYPYLYEDDAKKITISFDEWLKSYQPTRVRTISHELAQEWLQKIDYMLNYIEKKWREAEKAIDTDTKLVYQECPRNYNRVEREDR